MGPDTVIRWAVRRCALAAALAGIFSSVVAPASFRAWAQGNAPSTAADAPPVFSIPWRSTKDILEGMARIPAGQFLRGEDGGPADAGPARKLQMSNYYIDQREVSVGEYAACVRVGGCTPAREYGGTVTPEAPVVGVSWYQARAYCLWAGKRLPKEAEWEKAARGSTGWAYPWGDSFEPEKANFADGLTVGARGGKDGHGGAAPVDAYPEGASSYGVLNLSGNISEWVLDWYSASYYKRAPQRDPAGPPRGRMKVVRGGSFNSPFDDEGGPAGLRVTRREALDPHAARIFLGFRCAWRSDSDLTQEGDPEPNE